MDSGFYKHDRQESPRVRANIFSICSFWWLRELFTKGYEKQLEINDIYVSLKEHNAEKLGDECEAFWNEELKETKPSLLRILLKLYGVRLILINIVYTCVETCFRISQPLCLGVLLSYFSPGQTSLSKNEAYLYASGVVLSMLINAILLHPFLLEMFYISTKIRVSCSSMIYRKVLKLDLKTPSSEGEGLNGRVINLLTNDVGKFDMCCIFLMEIWRAPIESVIVIYIMYSNIGPASLIGVVFLLCFIPLQAWFSRINAGLRISTALKTDHRIKIMNEIIQGIQMIKMYAWENCFVKMIAHARKKEMNLIKKANWIRAVSLCCIKLNAKISIFISILAYVFFGNQITAAKIFVLFSLYDLIKLTLVEFFSLSLLSIMEAYVSICRIQDFLLLPEVSSCNRLNKDLKKSNLMITNGKNNINDIVNEKSSINLYDLCEKNAKEILLDEKDLLNKPVLELKNLKAEWNTKDFHENVKVNVALDDVSLNVSSGELVAIVGQVGSGKSVLFNSIIGEITLKSGSVKVNGVVSYYSQAPWLFEATIRQNILFGLKMNPLRYRQVIKCCQLENDLKSFPFGDKTIVGERGISLSGGQRARVSLARCIYKEADLYLLDDPLSAVDAKVGHKLFYKCIKGFLRSSAVIFVTHQLQHLTGANKICVMDSGKIVFEDNFNSFKNSPFNVAELFADDNDNDQKDTTPGDQKDDLHKRRPSLLSVGSRVSIDQIIEEESQKAGSVTLDVYKSFAKSAGGIHMLLCTLLLFISGQVFFSLCDWWISVWVNLEEIASSEQLQKSNITETIFDNITNNISSNSSETFEENLNNESFSFTIFGSWNLTRNECIYIYSGLIGLSIILTLSKLILFFNMCITASVNLHNSLFQGIIRATMWFFNNNSSGRILNRFSKDIGTIDTMLPPALVDCISFTFECVAIIVIVCIVNYWLLIPTFFLLVILICIRSIYIATGRSLKRLEGISRSPAFTHVNATMNGLDTIRSSSSQALLSTEFDRHLNLHTSVWTQILNTSRAFGVWMDMVCVIYLALVTYSFLVLSDNGVLGGKVGLAITQVIGLVGMCQWGVRQTAEVENQMTSVERISEYTRVPSEPPLETDMNKFAETYPNLQLKKWPNLGDLEFKNVYLSYDKNEENYVLKDVNFRVRSGEKVGIVGRTGAGKSSIIAALFRLTDTKGNIVLDGIETKTIGLHDLRPAMSIIPQEPMLFSGSLRKNLDPWDEYKDNQLWEVLEEVELKGAISNMAGGLDTKVADGGGNFSAGQRQLLCLARAALKNSQLLLLDEATANVDPETDQLIQKTIRRKFCDKSVLTIAHRLHTVMDSDKVLVMDGGRVMEFGHPFELLSIKGTSNQDNENIDDLMKNNEKNQNNGYFLSLVQQTGEPTCSMLIKIAEESYKKLQTENKLT